MSAAKSILDIFLPFLTSLWCLFPLSFFFLFLSFTHTLSLSIAFSLLSFCDIVFYLSYFSLLLFSFIDWSFGFHSGVWHFLWSNESEEKEKFAANIFCRWRKLLCPRLNQKLFDTSNETERRRGRRRRREREKVRERERVPKRIGWKNGLLRCWTNITECYSCVVIWRKNLSKNQ